MTVVTLFIVATGIALANLAQPLLTFDLIIVVKHVGKPAEHPLGWPIAWYWRPVVATAYNTPAAEYGQPHLSVWRNLETPWKTKAPVSRYRFSRLAADLAIWLAMLAAIWTAGSWLLPSHPSVRLRPRPTTLVLFLVVTALTVLANLSRDAQPERGPTQQCSYGWPWIWYRYVDAVNMVGVARYWDYSAVRLTGNLAVWLATLVAVGVSWQWVLDRHRPRLHFNLRTMLAGVAIVAALCAWCVATRNRADRQDALLELFGREPDIYFQRWGPKWLDLFGADRLRRRIVAARVDKWQKNDEVYEQLAGLRSLRLLDINPWLHRDSFVCTRRMADSLAEMRQLRLLAVNCRGDDLRDTRAATHDYLTSVSKLTNLKHLRLAMWEEHGDELTCLAGLANLKTLSLQIFPFRENSQDAERIEEAHTLTYLPPLPGLEVLDLDEWEIGDQELAKLASFPRLKSLNLAGTSVSDVGLATLALLDSLEELGIDEDIATSAAFESLAALKNLKAIHVASPRGERIEPVEDVSARRADSVLSDTASGEDLRPATLVLDDGHELPVLSGELDDLNRALKILRQSHPGVVIDAAYPEFLQGIGRVEPRWLNSSAIDSDMRRLLDL